jgi:hypothetical protein
MNSRLIALVLSVLIQFCAAGRRRPSIASITFGIVCVIVGMAMTSAALGCVAAALWIYVLPYAGAAGAALAAALVLAAAGGVFAILARGAWRRRPDRARAEPGVSSAGLPPAIAELAGLLRGNTGTLLIAAMVAGLAAGAGSRGSRPAK